MHIHVYICPQIYTRMYICICQHLCYFELSFEHLVAMFQYDSWHVKELVWFVIRRTVSSGTWASIYIGDYVCECACVCSRYFCEHVQGDVCCRDPQTNRSILLTLPPHASNNCSFKVDFAPSTFFRFFSSLFWHMSSHI